MDNVMRQFDINIIKKKLDDVEDKLWMSEDLDIPYKDLVDILNILSKIEEHILVRFNVEG